MPYEPAPGSGRIYLYTKPSRPDRAVAIVVTVIVVLALIIGIAAVSSTTAYLVLLLICIGLWAVTIPPVVLRTAAWLDGTSLTVRGAYTSHRCDLASGAVRLDRDPASGLPMLTAQDPTGRPVRVVLRERRRREALGPEKLHALADAIMAGGRQDAAGCEASGNLRALAGAPPVIPPRQ